MTVPIPVGCKSPVSSQCYIDSVDNDTVFADITKSAMIRFRFDVIQGPAINMRCIIAHLTQFIIKDAASAASGVRCVVFYLVSALFTYMCSVY